MEVIVDDDEVQTLVKQTKDVVEQNASECKVGIIQGMLLRSSNITDTTKVFSLDPSFSGEKESW